MRPRLHHLMWHTTVGGVPGRVLAWGVAWIAAVDWLIPLDAWWEAAFRAIAVGFTVAFACRTRAVYMLWIRLWKRKALHVPPVLDEDGKIHVAVLLPGERIAAAYDGDGRPIGAAVFRPNGSIRVEADWSHR